MQIRSVEAIPLSAPLPDGREVGHARGSTDARSGTLARVETDDGTVGWGEALAPPHSVAAVIEEVVAPRVRGIAPSEVESLADRLYAGPYHVARGPLTQCALAAVDVALWDIRGKLAGEPVFRLLGSGSPRELVPYASTMYFGSADEDPAASVERAVEEGFSAVKLKCGRGVESDVERVATARDVLGDDAALMIDCNGSYRPKQAFQVVKALDPYDLTWLEEPLPPEDLDGYQYLSERVDVPIAAGEAHYGRFEYRRLVDAVDVVQPDLSRTGGFSEARFVAKLATTANVAVRPHVWSGGVGLAAAVQYAASLSPYPHASDPLDPMLFEHDRAPNPLRTELLETPFSSTDGALDVPTDPGLGIDVDERAVERYRVD